ncbi:Proteasome regulatory particle subunit [Paramicrosporidium saccamoebae]|uniref:Proteasome regulatory particle subunit n=1 Tax=Paramicrosporidium saccamoebae TaxID=1246581 RepID=A0A2H9TNT9_9FUNG|nr:Proteasome regulatory particle subunit [Paramicrosporidium saccamoebae]
MMPVADPSLSAHLLVHLGLLSNAMETNERRLVVRVLQNLPTVRRRLEGHVLATLMTSSTLPLAQELHPLLGATSGKKTSSNSSSVASGAANSSPMPPTPTASATLNSFAEVYLFFLSAVYLLDAGQASEANVVLLQVARLIESLNSRILDPLLARCYYFLGRSAELQGISIHPPLMLAFRQAALRHDSETHATVYNLLLRVLVRSGQVEEADKLVQRSVFPSQVSGANHARHLYYVGCIRAVQTQYPEARRALEEALQKAPHGRLAAGFVQAVQKLLVVVLLLLGEIPERSLLRENFLSSALRPYLSLCQTVRLGDLTRFQQLLTEAHQRFDADRTLMLVQRLHQNVLRAGLKRLSSAYSRIPLTDVQRKLGLPSVEDTVFVLLKAIQDGVIGGEIDHHGGFLASASVPNPYYTTEPQESFNTRIVAINALHDDCLRAMRYPDGVKKTAITSEAAPTEEEMMEEYLEAEDDLGF